MNKETKKTIKIVILDGHSSFSQSTLDTLVQEGFSVSFFDHEDEFVEAFKSTRFHIILLDPAEFPGGFDILKKMREIDNDVATVVIRDTYDTGLILEALRLEVSDYIAKTASKADLMEVIHRMIKKKGLIVDFERKINLEIGIRIRNLRKERNLTLRQLANRTGLSISLISQIERAKSSSSVATLAKIATALSVKLEYFFQGL